MAHEPLIAARPRGRALDVACGLGRNALHLAAMGFEVDAIDVSDVAVAHVARAAAARRLPVRPRAWDLAAEPLPAGPYEVVVNAFFLERRLVPQLGRVLAPGGVLLFDTFLAEEGDETLYRLLPGELAQLLGDLDVVECREGPPEPGDRPRVRAVARRGGGSEPAGGLDSEAR